MTGAGQRRVLPLRTMDHDAVWEVGCWPSAAWAQAALGVLPVMLALAAVGLTLVHRARTPVGAAS